MISDVKPLLTVVTLASMALLSARICHAQQVQAQPASSIIARASPERDTSQIDSAIKLAQESLNHLQQNVDDYTALFVKRCRVNGQLPPMQYLSLIHI